MTLDDLVVIAGGLFFFSGFLLLVEFLYDSYRIRRKLKKDSDKLHQLDPMDATKDV